MATITAGTYFPTELVNEMFDAVRGRSALAKLSQEKPMAFTGATEFVFSAEGEAQLVAEGAAKAAGAAAVTPKVIKPVKLVYQQRVSDEFIRSGDETRLQYLEAFAEGFGRKIARGFDIAAMHGCDPKTGTVASFQSTNSFDGLATAVDLSNYNDIAEAIEDAINTTTTGDVNGIALSKDAGTALGALAANGLPLYPEFKFGQNPDAFYGMKSDVNSTVGVQYTGQAKQDLVIVGDFENAFRWGYAADIPLEVIEYGDPDGTGHDLKQYNEVCLRAEAYIGWAVLDAGAFCIVNK
jgi:HK97 family phage major capsid protein